MKVYIYTCLLSLAFIVNSHAQVDFAMGFGEFEDLPEFDEFSVPVVLTATRIQQHQADVPASVTILDSELIKQLGVQSLSELLRYVPGMMVGPDNNNNSDAVHYHGGPAALPKNLQVLINGRSMYRSGLAAVSWFEMPVALEDIRRIEVVRGPNASSYGANAYQAVINILTKHPADTYGTSVSYSGGNNGEDDVYLRQGGKVGETDYRLSFTQRKSDGFDEQDDSRVAKFFDFESHRQLDSGGELEASVVVLQATKGITEPVTYQTNENEIDEDRVELGLRWTLDVSNKHQLQVKAYVSQYSQSQTIDVANVPVALLDNNLRELFLLNPEAANSIADLNDPSSSINSSIESGLVAGLLDKYPHLTIDIDGIASHDSDLGELFALDPVAVNGDAIRVTTTTAELNAALAAQDANQFITYYSGLSDSDKRDIGLVNMYKLAAVFTSVGMESTGTALLNDYVGTLSVDEQAIASDFNDRYTTNQAQATAPVNGTINADMDEYRFDIEVQDTFVYSPSLTLVSGASFRRDVVKSSTYFDGEVNSNTSRLFGSATWQATENASAHLGLMFEKEDNADFVYAPRVALNYKITPSQSFRAVYSESVRSPDLFEQQAYWSYELDGAQIDPTQGTLNGTTFYQTQMGPDNLDHQFIESYELGYYGRIPFMDLETDVRIFHEHQADAFYQSLRLSALTTEEDISVRFEGVEWMLNFRPWRNGQLRWNAAVLNAFSNAADTGTEKTILKIYARNTTTFSWLQAWPFGINSAFSYLKADKYDQLHEEADEHFLFERIDGRLAKVAHLHGYEVELSTSFQHDLSSDPYISSNNIYEDDTRVQVGVRMSF
jgi:iron complex outermembrane receptor protein